MSALKSGYRDDVPDNAVCKICSHRCDQHGDWGRYSIHFASPCKVAGCMCGDFTEYKFAENGMKK